MKIVLTYDPRWAHTPEDQTPFWASMETVAEMAELLEKTGNTVLLLKADDALAFNLSEIMRKHADPLVFWLNEFTPTESGADMLTIRVIEEVGVPHTGPSAEASAIGLDKGATKDVFRRLGLPTPESYLLYPGDDSPRLPQGDGGGYVIIKPLQQGNSRGMDELSVIAAADRAAIKARAEQIHHHFNEPALVERYIGGEQAKEFTVPMLIAHDGRVAALPITEVDLSQIPAAQGQFAFLTPAVKDEDYYLRIPAGLPPESVSRIRAEVGQIIEEIGCRDMVRVDMRGDASGLYYIEVNVNPGKNKFSHLPAAAYSLGLNYSELIAFIPYQAMLKYNLKPPRKLAELVSPVLALFDQPK